MPAAICWRSRVFWSASLALGLRAGTDEIQITHIARDLLKD